jgi:phenylalanyl-tRNA synthetase beta chain
MRVPISWLKTFVDIDLPVEELAERLNLAGIEVEFIEGSGADQVLVLSILANTARAQSIVGVAREVAAITGSALHEDLDLADLPEQTASLRPTAAVAPELCRRFSVAEVANVKVTTSPPWLQHRLVLAGVDPINNIVDAANYVMFELGQPMHTYDADLLPDMRLGVRMSRVLERLHTIAQPDDEDPIVLPEGVLVIESSGAAVAVAGVIGGSESAINENTNRILIESANFDFISVRKSQSVLKTYTEASARFSRGVDPALTQRGIQRLLKLLSETSPEMEVKAWADLSRWDPEPRPIQISVSEVNDSLGTQFSLNDLVDLLERDRIPATANEAQQMVRALVPSSREDLQIPADLLEEFVRLGGYDRLMESMPEDPIPMHKRNVGLELRESGKDALVRWGLQEVITYTMTDPEVEQRLHLASESFTQPEYVRLRNPISSERTVMRRTLLPGLLDIIRRNLRYTDSCHVFEIGVVMLPEFPSTTPRLPAEPYRVALAMTGPIEPVSLLRSETRATDFYDALNAVEFLLNHLKVGPVSFTHAEASPFQPGVCAAVKTGEVVLGHVGALHPLVAAAFDLADRRVFCADLDFEEIRRRSTRFFRFEEPPRFPSINLDISAVVPNQLPAGELVEAVRSINNEFLRSVSVFDVYVGPQVAEGHKAIGLRLELNGIQRTLTIEEAHAVRDLAAARLREQFQAVIRE